MRPTLVSVCILAISLVACGGEEPGVTTGADPAANLDASTANELGASIERLEGTVQNFKVPASPEVQDLEEATAARAREVAPLIETYRGGASKAEQRDILRRIEEIAPEYVKYGTFGQPTALRSLAEDVPAVAAGRPDSISIQAVSDEVETIAEILDGAPPGVTFQGDDLDETIERLRADLSQDFPEQAARLELALEGDRASSVASFTGYARKHDMPRVLRECAIDFIEAEYADPTPSPPPTSREFDDLIFKAGRACARQHPDEAAAYANGL